MRLHTALGTGHRQCRLAHIQPFPDAQQEDLLLAQGQRLQGALQFRHAVAHLHALLRRALRFVHDIVQRIFRVIIAHTQPAAKTIAHRTATVPVVNATLQNTVEQRSPLLGVATGVFFHQLEHGVLHQIQRIVRIIGGDLRDPVRPALHVGQELVQVLQGIQLGFLRNGLWFWKLL